MTSKRFICTVVQIRPTFPVTFKLSTKDCSRSRTVPQANPELSLFPVRNMSSRTRQALDAMANPDKPYSGHESSVNDTYVKQPTVKGNVISFGFGYDSYDHFNYDVTINAKSKMAVVRAATEIDCLGSSEGVAVYDCNVYAGE